MILCSNPQAQYQVLKGDIDAAIREVFEGGRYILGPNVAALEQEFAAFIGVQYGIGVANGTDALKMALRACGISHGDEVITVSHTAAATVSAIAEIGAVPVLLDINPHDYTMDCEKLATALTKHTRAIVPVHLYGQCVDMDRVMEFARQHDLTVIEDCAQAHGALYKGKPAGSFGDMAAFSCYPTKNLGAIGDAGLIITDNGDLAEKTRQLREYGWNEKRETQSLGFNSRLDEIQAAILRVKLKHLDRFNEQRQFLAKEYQQGLQDLDLTLPVTREGNTHVYHLYVVCSSDREHLKRVLAKSEIYAGIHYPQAVHQQKGFQKVARIAGNLTNTEEAVQHILSLPMYPELSPDEMGKILECIRSAFRKV